MTFCRVAAVELSIFSVDDSSLDGHVAVEER